MTYLDDFRSVMNKRGISCDVSVIPDGEIHRFDVTGDNKNSLNGWYVFYAEPIPAGAFGCWKLGISEKWCSKKKESVSSEEWNSYLKLMEQAKQKQLEEKRLLQIEAQQRAQTIWVGAVPATDNHPYLSKKEVKAYGLHLTGDNRLIIPLYDKDDKLQSLQFISPEGRKTFLPHGGIKGNYFMLGEVTEKIYIAEGFATAATIHEVTNCCSIVAFNSGNLLSVTENLRQKYPDKKFIICADNDAWTKGNPGLTKGKEAAQFAHASFVFPDFNGLDVFSKPTDFNDLMRIASIPEVKKQLDNKMPTVEISEEINKGKNIATKMMELLSDVEFFHDEHRDAYATVNHNGHSETWLVDSNHFNQLLSKRYWDVHKNSISKNTLTEVLGIIKGKAVFDNEKPQQVFTRVASLNGEIYIHLANEQQEVVRITHAGWEILKKSPVKFRVTSAMRPLPSPHQGGNIEELWSLINMPKKSRKLVLAWILECFRLDTHFPILVINGIQGSAKSTTQDVLRSFIDPSTSNLRSAPRKGEDLLINAKNNWLVSFNNLSNLNSQQQDDLCSLSTGGGFSTRKLYTTTEEELVNIKRPVVLNGINDLVTQQDLIDRCIVVDLQPISESQRRTDHELQKQFKLAAPRLFGALLTCLSKALRELPNVQLAEKPRMADFALFGVALERALGWEPGSFMEEYKRANCENVTMAMEHSPVAIAVLQFMEANTVGYSGSFSELYTKLTKIKPDMAGWPKSPKGLANQLKRQSTALKIVNIEITFDSLRKKDGWHLKIKKCENNVHQVHHVHQSSDDAAFEGELVVKGERTSSLSASYVHPENPYPIRADEHGEHGELTNQKIFSDNAREVIVL